jgi:hypothetical protein
MLVPINNCVALWWITDVFMMKLALHSHGKLKILPASNSTELSLIMQMMLFCTNQLTAIAQALLGVTKCHKHNIW